MTLGIKLQEFVFEVLLASVYYKMTSMANIGHDYPSLFNIKYAFIYLYVELMVLWGNSFIVNMKIWPVVKSFNHPLQYEKIPDFQHLLWLENYTLLFFFKHRGIILCGIIYLKINILRIFSTYNFFSIFWEENNILQTYVNWIKIICIFYILIKFEYWWTMLHRNKQTDPVMSDITAV